VFDFHDTATTTIYTLSLHDALPIYTFEEIVQQVRDLHRDELIVVLVRNKSDLPDKGLGSTLDDALRRELLGSCASDLVVISAKRSEEHTSELQSRENLVCRLLLEKK